MTKRRLLSKSGKQAIKDARGVLKQKPGDKPFRQRWADYKKEEKALEEAKYARLRPR
ncbi:MAG TPA: hypothetical protein VEX43_12335 [Chthoniobacterales bacterium]|nr:hypothetical protein [Chthoniobacterales bacterium]